MISIAGGATPRRDDQSLYTDGGVKFLRILNIDDGEIVEQDLKYITSAVHEGDLERSQLAADDVLVTITGRVGSAAAVRDENLPANINQHIARLRVDQARCRPEFLVEWLNCPAGFQLSNRFVSGGTRSALDYRAIRNIRIPLPDSLEAQDELLVSMDKARKKRQEKLAAADELLASIDALLLSSLGLAPSSADDRIIFAVRRQDVLRRFDPHFFLPDLVQNTRMLTSTESVPLGSMVSFSKDVWMPEAHEGPTFRYIEIGTVDPQTGEAHATTTPVTEAPSRARMKVCTNDIIVSLTRPHHGSIAVITPELDGCVASTGFSVLRDINESRLDRAYLWCVLRAKMCLDQMLQRATGGNYPAITEQELAQVLLPVPALAVQKDIAVEVRHRQDQAHRLRAEAEQGWQNAKQWFEEQLLGEPKP